MDYKKTNAPLNTVTHDLIELAEPTGNIYETVCIISKRANQIAAEMKRDLEKKLQEFASMNDSLEEISENREQIEISKYYEHLPKPTLIATKEFEEGKIAYADIVILEQTNKSTFMEVTLMQGMNRQIRKMFEKVGYEVEILKRIQHATIKLDGLKRGEVKVLKPKAIRELQEFIKRRVDA